MHLLYAFGNKNCKDTGEPHKPTHYFHIHPVNTMNPHGPIRNGIMLAHVTICAPTLDVIISINTKEPNKHKSAAGRQSNCAAMPGWAAERAGMACRADQT